jgi:hypothetical protein
MHLKSHWIMTVAIERKMVIIHSGYMLHIHWKLLDYILVYLILYSYQLSHTVYVFSNMSCSLIASAGLTPIILNLLSRKFVFNL